MAPDATAVTSPRFLVGQIVSSHNNVVYQIKMVREATPKGTRYSVMRINADRKCFGPYRNLFDSTIKTAIEAAAQGENDSGIRSTSLEPV